jgi:hypothetical protein
MKKTKFGMRLFLLLSFGFFGATASSLAQTPQQQFNAQVTSDFQTISDYINGQFAKSMGFFSTLGWNTPPTVFDLVGNPKVQIGLGVGADLMSLSGINSLPVSLINVGSTVGIPNFLPLPFPILTARIGVLKGLDLGVRVSYIPQFDISDIGLGVGNTGYGISLRYKIFDGLGLPTVTVATTWDKMTGHFSLATNFDQSGYYNTVNSYEVSGTATYQQNWDVESFGAQLQVGKDLGVIYPFCAVGVQRNSGSVYSSFTAVGQETFNSTPSSLNITAGSSSLPVILEPKFVAGFDVGAGFHWGVVAESNGTDIAGSTSFRVQF